MINVLTKVSSLYHPRFVRSVVYLLQSSEYYLGDFFHSCLRTKNFAKTERRGQLDLTPKAIVILTKLYLTQGALIGVVIYLLVTKCYALAALIYLVIPILIIIIAMCVVALMKVFEKVVTSFYLKKATAIMRSHQGTVIAIAGSYGKTTTRNIITTILGGKLKVATPIKNHNTPLAIAKFINTLDGTEDVIVIECGEYYPGDVRTIAKMVQPDIGIITGINEAHLSRFGDLQATTETIFELAEEMPGKPVYVNIDDVRVAARATTDHMRYSNAGVGNSLCTLVNSDLTGQQFVIDQSGQNVTFTTPCIGPHVIGTVSVAIALAREFGIEDKLIESQLKTLTNPPHRFELRTLADNVQLLDDSYNGNPAGVKAMLDFLGTIKNRRIIYITPGLVELGTATIPVHEDIADQLVSLHATQIVLIDTPATKIIKNRLQTLKYTGLVTTVPQMTAILDKLKLITVPGDLVVIQNDWGDHYL